MTVDISVIQLRRLRQMELVLKGKLDSFKALGRPVNSLTSRYDVVRWAVKVLSQIKGIELERLDKENEEFCEVMALRGE